MPLLERVMKGADEDLANRVRAVLRLPQTLRTRPVQPAVASIDAKVMAERSLKAGFIRDALKYLQLAQEDDPADFAVMLKLGWTYNLLHNDRQAIRWFDLARKSSDPKIAKEANTAYRNLRPDLRNLPHHRLDLSPLLLPLERPVLLRPDQDRVAPGLSSSSLRQPALRGRHARHRRPGGQRRRAAVSYLRAPSFPASAWPPRLARPDRLGRSRLVGRISDASHRCPTIAAALSFTKGFGHLLKSKTGGVFFETNDDAIFVSRFDNDFLLYSQNRFGYTPALGALQTQFYWNVNLTTDQKREPWANFFETGPGLRFRVAAMPSSLYLTVNYLRGNYTVSGRSLRAHLQRFPSRILVCHHALNTTPPPGARPPAPPFEVRPCSCS